MAAPFSLSHQAGSDLNNVTLAADIAAGKPGDARLGEQRTGSNGRAFVYAQANAAITGATAVCTVNATTFLATASGGSYLSPTTTMASGDRGWFSRTSV